MKTASIGFIGAGRVTSFMIEGLRRGHPDIPMTVMDANPEAAKNLARNSPSVTDAGSSFEAVGNADILFIALHPQHAQAGCESVAPFLGKNTIVVSLAPKATIAALTLWLGTDKIARYLPNAATGAGKGYNPIAWGPSLKESGRNALRELLAPLGGMSEAREGDIETYAVLSAMGPTYLWPLLDEMISCGVRYGLPAQESARLVSRMAAACAEMIEEPGKDYAARMDMIPAKPMADIEQQLRSLFREKIDAVHAKLRG